MTKEYYLKHKKEIMARQKAYRKNIPDFYKKEYQRYGKEKARRDSAAKRNFYYKNKAYCLDVSRKWAKDNPQKRRCVCNKWYARNKKEQCERNKIRYHSNLEESRKRERDDARKLYWKNQEKVCQKNRKRYADNREHWQIYGCIKQYEKRWGIKLTEKEKERFKWLRKIRKEW